MYRNGCGASLAMSSETPFASEVLIDTTLALIAVHMTHLAATLESTEIAVSKLFKEAPIQNANAIQNVQNLDYLHQSMTDTASLLRSLGQGHRLQLALISDLKLEATRALVRGDTICETPKRNGVVDLF